MIKRTLIVIIYIVYISAALILLIISLITAPLQYILVGDPWYLVDMVAKKFSTIENKLNNFVENDQN